MTVRHRRPRARGGAAATAPWRRAPLLLLRQPAVFLALVGASAILAVAAASGPLFLSTIGTASLHAQARQSCPEDAQPTVLASVPTSGVAAAAADGVRDFAAQGLRPAYVAADGYAHVGTGLVHLFARPGALAHVTRLTADTGAAGVWVPDTFAAKLHLRAGDRFRTTGGATLAVAGLYRDLAPNPFALAHLAPYWCRYTDQIVSTVATDSAIAATAPQYRQGPWLIADRATVARASESDVDMLWSAPLSTRSHPLGAFDRAADRAGRAAAAMRGVAARRDPMLPRLVAAAHAARRGVTGSVVPIEIAGVVVAGLLVGGAGVFWATARQREIRLLVARGVGPAALAGKAVLETLPPALAGAVAGYFGTSALVRAVGPADVLEADAPRQALLLVAAVLVLGLALIGALAGLAGRERTAGRRVSWPVRVPWELALLATAIALAVRNRHRSAVTVDHTVVSISPLVVLYPLLGATAALVLVGRLVGLLLPGVGRAAGRRGTTPYLALRRISRSRAVVLGLIVGTALPCCLLMYASTVTGTISTEVTAKYRTNLGAPHVLQVYGVHGRLVDLHGTGSQVVIYRQDVTLGDGTPAYLLGVDPAGFARFAYTSARQAAAVRRIAQAAPGGPLPAILVNAPAGTDTARLHVGRTTVRLHALASMSVFPGLRDSAAPMIVVDEHAIGRIDPQIERLNQVWTDAAHYAAARSVIGTAGLTVLFQLTSAVVIGTTGLLPVTWLFGYLRALAVLIGVVAVAGLVFGLAARTRRRRVSYVLSRRMGMSKAAHLNSLLIELALVVGLGWVAGSGLGIGSFGFTYRAFDVYPELAPAARFSVPRSPVLVTAGVAAAVVLIAAVATQLLAERTRPAEILRLE